MTEQLPPDWAIERAREVLEINDPRYPGNGHGQIASWITKAVARYIAEHEEPPVDPLLVEAREIAASLAGDAAYHRNWADSVRAGKYDAEDRVQGALAALKRGIEIGKGQQ